MPGYFGCRGRPRDRKTTCIPGLLHALGVWACRLAGWCWRRLLGGGFRVTSSLRSREEGSEHSTRQSRRRLEANPCTGCWNISGSRPICRHEGPSSGHRLRKSWTKFHGGSGHAACAAAGAAGRFRCGVCGRQNKLPAVGQGAPFQTAWVFLLQAGFLSAWSELSGLLALFRIWSVC